MTSPRLGCLGQAKGPAPERERTGPWLGRVDLMPCGQRNGPGGERGEPSPSLGASGQAGEGANCAQFSQRARSQRLTAAALTARRALCRPCRLLRPLSMPIPASGPSSLCRAGRSHRSAPHVDAPKHARPANWGTFFRRRSPARRSGRFVTNGHAVTRTPVTRTPYYTKQYRVFGTYCVSVSIRLSPSPIRARLGGARWGAFVCERSPRGTS